MNNKHAQSSATAFQFLRVCGRAILITKTKTRTKVIAIRLLKLKLEQKYSRKLKLYKTILTHG